MLSKLWQIIRDWSSKYASPFSEALKEAFRVTLFSIPGQLIVFIENKNFVLEAVLVNIVLIFLRALDKYLYEKSKIKGATGLDGLSPI